MVLVLKKVLKKDKGSKILEPLHLKNQSHDNLKSTFMRL